MTSQSLGESRLPQLPKIIFHTIRDRIREKTSYLNKTKSTVIKPQTSITDAGSSKDVYMWGEKITLGENGNSVVLDTLLPVLLWEASEILDIRSISCGRNHTGVVTGQGEVFCWGQDNGGGLGHKISIDVPGPKIVESLKAVHVVTIECGGDRTCALTDFGELYGWGDSSYGAEVLDNRWKRNNWIPHKFSGALDGIYVERVACGDWHTAVVSSTGQLFTFGIGTFGVLGHGNSDDVPEPKEVESLKGLRVKCVACGPWHTAAIVKITQVDRFGRNLPGGKLFTWGDNEKGRLGHGNSGGDKRFLLPTCVTSLVDCDFTQVSCGYTMTIGLTVAGKVITVGSSENNCITAVEGCLVYKFIKKIAAGPHHAVCLTTEGEVYCWGKGANGRLGLGDIDDRNSPTLVQSLSDKSVEAIACGSKFTVAICSSDKLNSQRRQIQYSICKGCKLAFSFTRRCHSCYKCGFSFCNWCASKRPPDTILSTETIRRSKHFRVCDPCFAQLGGMDKKRIFASTLRLPRFTATTNDDPPQFTSDSSSQNPANKKIIIQSGGKEWHRLQAEVN